MTFPTPLPLSFTQTAGVGEHKFNEVQRLMRLLGDDLQQGKLSPAQRQAALQQTKTYGRDPHNADSLFCEAGITTLAEYGLNQTPPTVSQEALRCLANTLLLEPKLRQTFIDLGYVERAAERLKGQDVNDEFLISRVLFLLTYDTSVDFSVIFDRGDLANSIIRHISRHAKQLARAGADIQDNGVQLTALCESLKLLFNLSNFYPNKAVVFTPLIGEIFKIIRHLPIPKPPLHAPVNYLINALVNLDFESYNDSNSSSNHIFPTSSPSCNVGRLIDILNQAVAAYRPEDLETLAVPLLTVMRKVYDIAPEEAKGHMQELLLPKDNDRDLPLGKSDDLASRLLRLSTSPVAPQLREAISSLLFELSGKSAKALIRNIGYGYAAGYLMSHNIPVPSFAEEAKRADEGEFEEWIDPVTGQRLDKQSHDTEPEMSNAEKEKEAERLFVLFERLKATGVVDVKNPIQQAVESGTLANRVEEIEDPD